MKMSERVKNIVRFFVNNVRGETLEQVEKRALILLWSVLLNLALGGLVVVLLVRLAAKG